MTRLAQAIADQIVAHVKAQVSNLNRQNAEFRAVFNGPPNGILDHVFRLLSQDGGIEVTLTSGEDIVVPVLLQVDKLADSHINPPIGVSGLCNDRHLMDIRNANNCPRFVGLVTPGGAANLSLTSTRSDFGLSAKNNSGTASISDWYGDKLIQDLINSALSRCEWASLAYREAALNLIEHAIYSANEVDPYDVSRIDPWMLLSRVWSISNTNTLSFCTQLSLACGYPPCNDGLLDFDAQRKALKLLSDRFDGEGFRLAIDRIKKGHDGDTQTFLDKFLDHIQSKCDVPTVFERSASYYYGPFSDEVIDSPPDWWTYLTAEKWLELLDDETTEKDAGKLVLECVNVFVSQAKGIVPVVESAVTLRLTFPENFSTGQNVIVTRQAGRGSKGEMKWIIQADGSEYVEIIDDDIPSHKKPIKYSAEAVESSAKKSSLRVISLATWELGVVVCSRAATKTQILTEAKASREKVSFETTLMLSGVGRHYLDVYLRPGVAVASQAFRSNESGLVDDQSPASSISKITESEFGFEVDASENCFYQLEINRPEVNNVESLRIYLSCDEVDPDVCASEFERLIRLNRQKGGGRAATEVHVNLQLRSSDLQSWILDEEKIRQSYYPLVLVADYAQDWRTRDWGSQVDTIFSRGRFLNDPRPKPEEMQPPEAFLNARAALAEKIRGSDAGLIEAARLGEWLASDEDNDFVEVIEAYVGSYIEWLEASPETAAWCDISIYTHFESDGETLFQEPDAILVSPIHPIRLAWHCVAQRALFLAHRKTPCPAASILDPDCIPDAISLPLRTASGGVKMQLFFSLECSSDYWSILWNASKLDKLSTFMGEAPFNQDFGVEIGGMSSGFSVSQVHRALNDVSEMLVAKPVLNILLSSASGQNNACNQGLIEWCVEHYSPEDVEKNNVRSMGYKLIQVLDERKEATRPEDADISNLAEDTDNSVRWYGGTFSDEIVPDLGIIAQLETSNAGFEEIKVGSPIARGALIRHRIRQQLKAGDGAFLCESRMSLPRPPTGDGIVDKTMTAICHLENLGQSRYGYTFAPSVRSIQSALKKAAYVAVSSSSVDPACFLGGWLDSAFLWDYDLPSYSNRSGDSNGYYLLSEIKPLDIETLQSVLSRLPPSGDFNELKLNQIILEVARRGIPTVRGLSSGDSGASGDLGMFVASRFLQDEFRLAEQVPSLLRVLHENDNFIQIALLIPIDPFRGYIDDLTKAISKSSNQRPDLILVGICISDSKVSCKLTPIEVKFRGAKEAMPDSARRDALKQATSLSNLFESLIDLGNEPKMDLWKIAFQHLLVSILDFGFRVYSQQVAASTQSSKWSAYHARVTEAVFSEEVGLEVDRAGRLIVIDGSSQSSSCDHDGDDFHETIVINHKDASKIVYGDCGSFYDVIKSKVGDWGLLPSIAADENGKENIKLGDQETTAVIETPDSTDSNKPLEYVGQGQEKPVQPTLEKLKETGPESLTTNPNLRFKIGHTVDGFQKEERSICMSDTNLNHLNMGVVGDLGTGKTQLLKSLIYQINHGAKSNNGVKPRILIFDYKKDYASSDFVQAVGARVVKPFHLPINLFDLASVGDSMVPWLDRFRFFADVLDKIFSGVGPVQRAHLKTAIRKAYEECEALGRQPNIYDVHANYHLIVGSKVDSVSSILDDLVDMELFAKDSSKSVKFEDFLDGVVVIALNELGQDDKTKNMLVAIMLNMFYEHMLHIEKRPFIGEGNKYRVIDSYLLVDEADNIMFYEFDVLRKILLQGREFGVGVILASQYLRHFKRGATDYREPLLTWFIHKVPNVTAQELSALGFTGNLTYLAELAERVKSLGLHECLYKSFDNTGEVIKGTPFYKLIENQNN